MDTEATLASYGGAAFRGWLSHCFAVLFNHGSVLVDALGYKCDNVYAAERCLRAAEGAGWIRRCKLTPTKEQQFFDVNGSLKYSPESCLTCMGWEPVMCVGACMYLDSI